MSRVLVGVFVVAIAAATATVLHFIAPERGTSAPIAPFECSLTRSEFERYVDHNYPVLAAIAVPGADIVLPQQIVDPRPYIGLRLWDSTPSVTLLLSVGDHGLTNVHSVTFH